MTRIGFVASILFLAACTRLDHLEIDPKEVVFKRKVEGTWVKCVGKNKANHVVPKVKCTWSIKDEKIATVDKDGKVSAKAAGQTTLTAQSDRFEAEAVVRVESVEKLVVEPASLTLTEGGEAKALKVTATTYADRVINDAKPQYRTENPDVAALADEKIWPGKPGSTKVKVIVETESVDVPVTVKPKSGAKVAKAEAKAAKGKKKKRK